MLVKTVFIDMDLDKTIYELMENIAVTTSTSKEHVAEILEIHRNIQREDPMHHYNYALQVPLQVTHHQYYVFFSSMAERLPC